MTKRASGEKLPTVNNIHKLRGRLTTLEDGDEAGLTSDDIGDGLVLKDKKIEVSMGDGLVLKDNKIEVSTIGDSLRIFGDTGQLCVNVVLQPFVGGAGAVSVSGSARSAYSLNDPLRSGSNWLFYDSNPLQISVINYGLGVMSRVYLRGQLKVGTVIIANEYDSLQWDDILHYFGDRTPTSLINTVGYEFPYSWAKWRPYGPDKSIWIPVIRRVDATGNYETILGEVHMKSGSSGGSSTYFMRFNTTLQVGDRVIFDGVSYWSEHFPF